MTPLMEAAKNRATNFRIIRELLDAGANVNATAEYFELLMNRDGKTALHFAAEIGYTDAVVMITGMDAFVNAKAEYDTVNA